MAESAMKDDDLIIIAEDTHSDPFTDTFMTSKKVDNNEITWTMEDIITFDDDTSNDWVDWLLIWEESKKDNQENSSDQLIDFNIDMNDELWEKDNKDIKNESLKSNEGSMDLDFGNLETSNESSIIEDFTMESILNETILKLSKRQNLILEEEKAAEAHIGQLNSQIRNLETQKAEETLKKDNLIEENKQITLNKKELEKMKSHDNVLKQQNAMRKKN